MRSSSALVIFLHCLYGFVCPEEHDRQRRDLSMLRMGKRGLELLPARSISLPPLVPPNYGAGDDFEEREVVIPEELLIPSSENQIDYDGRISRASYPPFPRMGITFEDYLNEIRREVGDDELRHILLKSRVGRSTRSRRSVDYADEEEAKSLNTRIVPFPRLGVREEDELNEDDDITSDSYRGIPFPRLSIRDEEVLDENERAFPRIGFVERAFPRIGLRDEERRAFPRIGLREYDDDVIENEVERAFPRIGLREESERALPIPRMGLRDKKAMGMLRMGRSDESSLENDDEKRGMSMLRMGKRAMGMLRMGKRPVSMLRMGRSPENTNEDEKRAMHMLRMGKRAMGMLRMGRSEGTDTEEEKRAMHMLRMGKRGMSMLRMGRSDNSDAEKRAMGMLRMGRGMSMLRMGRSENSLPEQDEKRAMSMLRMGKRPVSMLRMGKRDIDDVQSASADEQDDSATNES